MIPSRMQAAVYKGIREIAIEEVPVPSLESTDILVRVETCGVCGSDLHSYLHGAFVQPGQIMGHEFAGEVVAVGPGVLDIPVGMRIAARPVVPCYACEPCLRAEYQLCRHAFEQSIAYGIPGAYAQYVRIPKAKIGVTIHPLPDTLSWEEAGVVNPLVIAMHTARQAQPLAGEVALVFGAGPIGAFVAQLLDRVFHARVLVIEPQPARRALVEKWGIPTIDPRSTSVVEEVARITGPGHYGKGAYADLAIDCAGAPSSLQTALECTRHGGRIAVVALSSEPVKVDPNLFVQKQITIYGCFAYAFDYDSVRWLIEKGIIDLKSMITGSYSLANIETSFTDLIEKGAVKALIWPNR